MGENEVGRIGPINAGGRPLVLTLRSGAALANASAYRCVSLDQNSPKVRAADPLLEPSQADNHPWVRKSVPCRQLEIKNRILR